jgi:hypothetical protein
VRAASGGGQLTEREPIFLPGGIIRVVAFLLFIAVMMLIASVLHVGMDALLTWLGWPASGQ